jgi:DNA-binding NarL/FixJ family response regulator
MNLRRRTHAHALDPVSASGLEAELRDHPQIELIEFGEAADDESVAVAAVETLGEPELVMVRKAKRYGCRKMVVVCSSPQGLDLFQAIDLGICAILPRHEATTARLVRAVRSAAAGEAAIPSDMLEKLLAQVGKIQQDVLTPRGLRASGMADREVKILRLVADGMDTREIAHQLAYSERTVKNVLHDVTTRFQLKNRSHAVAYAVREGLI